MLMQQGKRQQVMQYVRRIRVWFVIGMGLCMQGFAQQPLQSISGGQVVTTSSVLGVPLLVQGQAAKSNLPLSGRTSLTAQDQQGNALLPQFRNYLSSSRFMEQSVAPSSGSFLKRLQAFLQPVVRQIMPALTQNYFTAYKTVRTLDAQTSLVFPAYYGASNNSLRIIDTFRNYQEVVGQMFRQIWRVCNASFQDSGMRCVFQNSSPASAGVTMGIMPVSAMRCAVNTCCPFNEQTTSCPGVFQYSNAQLQLSNINDACVGQSPSAIRQCALMMLQKDQPVCQRPVVTERSGGQSISSDGIVYARLSFANVVTGSCAVDYSPFFPPPLPSEAQARSLLFVDTSDVCRLPVVMRGQGCTFARSAVGAGSSTSTSVWNGMSGLLENQGTLVEIQRDLEAAENSAQPGTVQSYLQNAGRGKAFAARCMIAAAREMYSRVAQCPRSGACNPYIGPFQNNIPTTLAGLMQLSGAARSACAPLANTGVLSDYGAQVDTLLRQMMALKMDLGGAVIGTLAHILDEMNTELMVVMQKSWMSQISEQMCSVAEGYLRIPAENASMFFLNNTPPILAQEQTQQLQTSPLAFSQNLSTMQSSDTYEARNFFIEQLVSMKSPYFFPVWQFLIQKVTQPYVLKLVRCGNGTPIAEVNVPASNQMIFVRNGRLMHYVRTNACMGEGLVDSFFVGNRPLRFKTPEVLDAALSNQAQIRFVVDGIVKKEIRKWTNTALFKAVYTDLLEYALRRQAALCREGESGAACAFNYAQIRRQVVSSMLTQIQAGSGEGVLASGLELLALFYFDQYQVYEAQENEILTRLLLFSKEVLLRMEAEQESAETIQESLVQAFTGESA